MASDRTGIIAAARGARTAHSVDPPRAGAGAEGMVLVPGGHRGRSTDDRHFSLVPACQLYGKALGIYRRSGEDPVRQLL